MGKIVGSAKMSQEGDKFWLMAIKCKQTTINLLDLQRETQEFNN